MLIKNYPSYNLINKKVFLVKYKTEFNSESWSCFKVITFQLYYFMYILYIFVTHTMPE